MKLELLFHLFILTVEVPKYHTEAGRIARDESNKNVYVSSDMSYGEYKAKYVTNDVEKMQNKGYNKNKQAVIKYRLADEKLAYEF